MKGVAGMEREERLSAGIFPLLAWYGENQRDLPWRREVTPYRVWVSEIMLQQTRVAAVLDYFQRFMAALPTVEALAACPEEQLFKLWQGLGYYSRARNLQRAARVLVSEYGGRFPGTYAELRALPGIGDYTAGAIASIAFGLPEPAVDGNVLRVLSRLVGETWDISKPQTKRACRDLLAPVMPLENPGALNQALMDLGATVCLPNGAPLCHACPWAGLCLAHLEEKTGEIPVKGQKKARRIERRRVFLIIDKGRVALRKRPDSGLLASLWELPNELGEALPLDAWGIVPRSLADGGKGKHIFTHVEWHMTGVVVRPAGETLPAGWVWADRGELQEKYPIPSAFSPFLGQVRQLLQEEEPT